MRREIRLSPKESRRVYIMEQVAGGKLTVRQGAELLGLSKRQVKRLKRRVMEKGVAGLMHGNRSRQPINAIRADVRDRVLGMMQDVLKGASCQHASELLDRRYGITVSARSIRRILAGAGLENPHARRCRRQRRSRDRMPQEGLLVQCDASPYQWLEDRGPSANLHGAIDDATGKVLGLYFRPQEDLVGHLTVLGQMIQRHGVPCRLYSDMHTIFFSPKKDKLSIEEELSGQRVALTQYGRALEDLGIGHVAARSAEAKGRVERLWNTLQHRLVIELRLEGIDTLEDANAFLPTFIARHNRRFAVAPDQPGSALSPCPQHPDRIICAKHTRKASNGSTISYRGCTYQLVNSKGKVASLIPRAQITVLGHLDGSLTALYKDGHYPLREFVQPKPQPQPQAPLAPRPKTVIKPRADHPWRQSMSLTRRNHSRVDRYFDDNWGLHWQSAIET